MNSLVYKLKGYELDEMRSPPREEIELLKSIDTREVKSEYENIDPANKILTSVEQQMLVSYFVFGFYDFVSKIQSIQKYGVKSAERIATHFNHVTYLYSKGELKTIQLEKAKKNSVELFGEQYRSGKISNFVKDLHLNPGYQNESFPRSPNNNTLYAIKNDELEPLSEEEKILEKSLIQYLENISHFNTQPNMLFLNNKLKDNFGIRLLASVFKNIHCAVEEQTNKIVFIGAKN